MASTSHDLLAALDAFLEEVTVLPPGRWDPTAGFPHLNACPLSTKGIWRGHHAIEILPVLRNGSGGGGGREEKGQTCALLDPVFHY